MQTVGISGQRFLILVYAVCLVMFVVGAVLSPSVLGAGLGATLNPVPDFLLLVVVKLVSAAVLTLLFAYIAFEHVLDTPLAKLPEQFLGERNDNDAIVLGGIMVLSGILVIYSAGDSYAEYLVNLCLKGSVSLAIALACTTIGSRVLYNVRSMDQFRDRIFAEHNQSHAILVMALLNAVAWVVMSS